MGQAVDGELGAAEGCSTDGAHHQPSRHRVRGARAEAEPVFVLFGRFRGATRRERHGLRGDGDNGKGRECCVHAVFDAVLI
ncbi:MAG: hypothetical protein EB084_08120 [Proteobacteria bacterium]|nr:hypothetical protein [Pseudomonadota bacterium]